MAVFIHGNPDPESVWNDLRAELGEVESVALSLPGFGTPTPDGFQCTRWDYAHWLIDELKGLGEKVDVVTHDIGGLIFHGVLRERPDFVRSWVLGSAACYPDFVWHPQARIWQTTRLGEETRHEFGRRLSREVGATLHIFKGCGHWRQVERPGEAAEALQTFWEAL